MTRTTKTPARKPAAKAETLKGKLVTAGKAAKAAPAAAPKPLGKRAALEQAALDGNLVAIRPDFEMISPVTGLRTTTHDSWLRHIEAADSLIAAGNLGAIENFAEAWKPADHAASPEAYWLASSTRTMIYNWLRRAAIALRAKGKKPGNKAAGIKAAREALATARAEAKAARLESAAKAAKASAPAAKGKVAAKAAPAARKPAGRKAAPVARKAAPVKGKAAKPAARKAGRK